MKYFAVVSLPTVFAIALAVGSAPAVAAKPQTLTSTVSPITSASYAKIPLSFEANEGQTDPSIQYLSRGPGYMLALEPGVASFALRPAGEGDTKSATQISLRLAGANPHAIAAHEDPQITRTNYIIGNDPTKWHTDVPNFGRVRYSSVYPGVDLVYYGNQQQLEHDFVVAPHGDPSRITLDIRGAQPKIDPKTGDLILSTNVESNLRLLAPVTYQTINGRRNTVPSSYKLLADNHVTFKVGAYDHAHTLTIDPVLVYSTYLGGSGHFDDNGDKGSAIAVDSAGNAYITGQAMSTDFPVTTGAFQTKDPAVYLTPMTIFVSKLNASGSALLYSTYLGGTANCTRNGCFEGAGDFVAGIALDSSNNAHVTGKTTSRDFPTSTGAFQTTFPTTGGTNYSAFVTSLNADGSGLVYSTYLGGSVTQAGQAIALDSTGDAFVTGSTTSSDFPITSGTEPSESSGFVAKLNPTGTGLIYSTTILSGGVPLGIAIDSLGDAYVAGYTSSSTFPVTTGAFQPAPTHDEITGFVSKINPAGTALVYSTTVGGHVAGSVQRGVITDPIAIAVDTNDFVYVAGGTNAKDFPVTSGVIWPKGNFTPAYGTSFVSKLKTDGTGLVYSTFFEGIGVGINALAIDSAGKAYVAGSIDGGTGIGFMNFSGTPDALPFNASSGNLGFVARLNTTATEMEYATLLGGSDTPLDLINAMALDGSGNVYVTGQTQSIDFPVTSGAFQSVNNATNNHSGTAFVSKLALAGEVFNDHVVTAVTIGTSIAVAGPGQVPTLTATVTVPRGSTVAKGQVLFYGKGVPPTQATLNASGVATWLASTLPPGQYDISALYLGDQTHFSGNTGASPASVTVQGGAAAVIAVSGPHFTTSYAYMPGPYQLCAKVVDSGNNPLPGVTISFTGSGMNFSPANPVSGADGIGCSEASLILLSGDEIATASAPGATQSASFEITITPEPLYITMRMELPRIYGSANPTFPYTIVGLVGSDMVTVTQSTPATTTSPVGSYPVTATISGPRASGYQLNVIPGTLDIRPATLQVQPSPGTRSSGYGQPIPPLSGFALSGFLNGDTAAVVSGTPLLSTTATSTSPVGVYPLNIAQGTLAATNYVFQFKPGKYYIDKAVLTATPGSFSIRVGDPFPAFTYTLSGFVNGDTAAVVTGTPVLGTTAPNTLTPGRFYTTGSNGSLTSTNYNFNWTKGVLTITR